MILLAALGCSSGKADLASVPRQNGDDDALSATLRIDVLPPATSELDAIRALPMSLTEDVSGLAAVDLGTVTMATPAPLDGAITALRTNPMVASLPATEVGVLATVRLRVPDTITSWSSRSTEDGLFEALIVPDAPYTLSVIPDDPLLPAWVGPLPGDDDLAPLALGYGAPVYGLVTSTDGPVAGALVVATAADGTTTAAAVTDATGFYQLRVSPGEWAVRCDGRPRSEDPVLETGRLPIGPDGLFQSFPYPTDLSGVFVDGVVTAPDGRGLADARVRLTATSLVDVALPGVAASFAREVTVSGDGSWAAALPAGTYDVEVLPPVADDGSVTVGPARTTGVDLRADTGLDLVATRLRTVRATVQDEAGTLIEGARIGCVETGFDQHEHVVFTGPRGRADLSLPATALRCWVSPPGDRVDLAVTAVVVDGTSTGDLALRLPSGVEVSGEVAVADDPAPGAVVQIRDPAGSLLGFDVTDDGGEFAIRVDPALAAAP